MEEGRNRKTSTPQPHLAENGMSTHLTPQFCIDLYLSIKKVKEALRHCPKQRPAGTKSPGTRERSNKPALRTQDGGHLTVAPAGVTDSRQALWELKSGFHTRPGNFSLSQNPLLDIRAKGHKRRPELVLRLAPGGCLEIATSAKKGGDLLFRATPEGRETVSAWLRK